jgi:hypothetical protein
MNMDNQKSMDLGAVKEQIAQHTKVLDKSAWSIKNLTANNNLEDIIPVGDRL